MFKQNIGFQGRCHRYNSIQFSKTVNFTLWTLRNREKQKIEKHASPCRTNVLLFIVFEINNLLHPLLFRKTNVPRHFNRAMFPRERPEKLILLVLPWTSVKFCHTRLTRFPIAAGKIFPRFIHDLDNGIQGNRPGRKEKIGKAERIQGAHRSNGITLDTRNLHQSRNRIAGQPQMMLDTDLRRIFDLIITQFEHFREYPAAMAQALPISA